VPIKSQTTLNKNTLEPIIDPEVYAALPRKKYMDILTKLENTSASIEYLDNEETDTCLIAMNSDEIGPYHTHLEIHPSTILSIVRISRKKLDGGQYDNRSYINIREIFGSDAVATAAIEKYFGEGTTATTTICTHTEDPAHSLASPLRHHHLVGKRAETHYYPNSYAT
jgi:hypothetical protein